MKFVGILLLLATLTGCIVPYGGDGKDHPYQWVGKWCQSPRTVAVFPGSPQCNPLIDQLVGTSCFESDATLLGCSMGAQCQAECAPIN